MALAGWEIQYLDLDLTQDRPVAEVRLMRGDGRWVFARVDRLGRCTVETFHRRTFLGVFGAVTRHKPPQSPQIEDVFLGRFKPAGVRAMLRHLTAYVVDNAMRPVSLAEVRGAWALVMAAPLRMLE